MSDDKYRIVTCLDIRCRANSFEKGEGPGYCPACGYLGHCMSCVQRLDVCACGHS